ncbi:hypothetical protein [uncultured Pseudoflavonifractor sp.]|uniref:hypothetical protein n=1 Tax=uncultured Pseudoflavonifractor sp. TaxID=1221379 RepID=UPI0025DDC22D|nr:hypothetical protein [uncultured Pseudoflavonifractor sp.]
MNQQDHNNEEQEVQHLQHEAEHAKPHKKVSVMGYLTILFAAAFLLLLLSYFMQQRANEQAISGLQATSSNAFDSINNLIAEKDELAQQVEDLEGQVAGLQEELDTAQSQLSDAQADAETAQTAQADAQKALEAMDWFWRIQRQFSRGYYTDAANIMAEFEASGLPQYLPQEALTGREGDPSPAQQYQDIKDVLG